VGDLAGDAAKWKQTWHDMESDLADARQEIRMLKRSQHDKALGLETTLTRKEGALEQANREIDELQRKHRNAEAEVERCVSLSCSASSSFLSLSLIAEASAFRGCSAILRIYIVYWNLANCGCSAILRLSCESGASLRDARG